MGGWEVGRNKGRKGGREGIIIVICMAVVQQYDTAAAVDAHRGRAGRSVRGREEREGRGGEGREASNNSPSHHKSAGPAKFLGFQVCVSVFVCARVRSRVRI